MAETVRERRREVLRHAARRATELPRCETCGLWEHKDIRDNVYFAMHGIILELEEGGHAGLYEICLDVLHRMLALQQTDPEREMYGYWPLTMPATHEDVKPHVLPVELMGLLLAVFARRYGDRLPANVRQSLKEALRHVYESRLYDRGVGAYNHHESKFTAHKLLHGAMYGDAELTARGHADLRALLARLRERGMREYGALPWFWHWVQAMACAWEFVPEGELRTDLEAVLRLLWEERSRWYLRGAWAGAHSRALPHDVPSDLNVLLDYVQFGDFSLSPLAGAVPRLEGAGLLAYEMPADVRAAGIRAGAAAAAPAELQQKIVLAAEGDAGASGASPFSSEGHLYLYRMPGYAVGGIWERTHEYDNEQHRWDVTLPMRAGGNQAYMFHPGDRYKEGDPRHSGDGESVAFARHAVLAVYDIASASECRIVGRLPAGTWRIEEDACCGEADGVYIAVRSLRPLAAEPDARGGWALASEGRFNAVAVEAWGAEEAETLGIIGLDAFASAVRSLPLLVERGSDRLPVRVNYTALDGTPLALEAPGLGPGTGTGSAVAWAWRPYVNGRAVDFAEYRIMTKGTA